MKNKSSIKYMFALALLLASFSFALFSIQPGDNFMAITGLTTISGGGGNLSTLIIYDDLDLSGSDGTLIQNYVFYANYSNTTDSVNITGATCDINFTDLSGAMTYNTTSTFYEFVRNFSSSGQKHYNISCYASTFEQLNATDSINVTNFANCDSCDSCSRAAQIGNLTVNLTQSINTTVSCINLSDSDNIVIDCNSFLINSTAAAASDVSLISGGSVDYPLDMNDRISVKNCNLSGTAGSAIKLNGTAFFAANLNLENIDTGSGSAVNIHGGNDSCIVNSSFINLDNIAVYLYGNSRSNFTLDSCFFDTNTYGFLIDGGIVNEIKITNNIFSNSATSAVLMQVLAPFTAAGLLFSNNTITNVSTDHGVFTNAITNINISDNCFINVSGKGIYVIASQNGTISNNIVDLCGTGIDLTTSGNMTISNNSLTNSTTAIMITASGNSTITRNSILSSEYGIDVGGGSFFDIITQNYVSGISGQADSAAINLQNGAGNTSVINGNLLFNSTYGIRIGSVSGLIIANNTIENNSFDILSSTQISYSFEKGNNSVDFPSILNVSNSQQNIFLNDSIISINASLELSLNRSANVTLVLPYGTCPAKIYYYGSFTTNRSLIVDDGQLCTASTNPACTNMVCSGNLISFTVAHFDGYAVGFGTAPEVNNVILNSTYSTNFTTENLTAYWNSTDPENDTVVNITDWRIDGVSYARLNLPFEGGSNSTYTKDYSSYNADVFVVNATWNYTGGHDGYGAYDFNGNRSYIYTPLNASDFNRSMAVSLWLKTESNGSVMGFSDGIPFGGNYDKEITVMGDGSIDFRLYPNDPYIGAATTGVDVMDGLWHHLAVIRSFDEGTFIYVDGVLRASTTSIENESQGYEGYLTVGINTQHKIYFNGTIDNFLIFNKSISSQEVLLLNVSRTDTLSKYETLTGENWSVCVTPNDGTFDGTTVCSNNISIRNKAEFISVYPNQTNEWQNITADDTNITLTINSTSSQNTTFNVTITADSATFTFSWFVNGILEFVDVVVNGFISMFSRIFLATDMTNVTVVVNSTEAGVNDTFTFHVNVTCLIPSADGFTLNEDGITLCPGNYTINGSIIINTSNVYLSCDGSTLTGNATNQAFKQVSLHSISNITIRDCIFKNFNGAIYLMNVSTAYFLNNSFHNNTYGIFVSSSINATISNNTFYSGLYGIVNDVEGDKNTISYNNFYNQTGEAISIIQKGPTIEYNVFDGCTLGIGLEFNPYGGGNANRNLIGSNIIKNNSIGIRARASYHNQFTDLNISYTRQAFLFSDVPSFGAVNVNNSIINPLFLGNTHDVVFNYDANESDNNTLFINDTLANSVTFFLVGNITNLTNNYFLNSSIIAVNTTGEPNLNTNATVSFAVPSCSVELFRNTGYYEEISGAESEASQCTSCENIVCANSIMNFTTPSFSTIFAASIPNITEIFPNSTNGTPPVLGEDTNVSIVVETGTNITYNVTALDYDSATLTFSWFVDGVEALVEAVVGVLNTFVSIFNKIFSDIAYHNITLVINDSARQDNFTFYVLSNDTISPLFNESLSNITAEVGEAIAYDVNASDLFFDKYSVNDTTRFKINSSTGLLENATFVSYGWYEINISVNDTNNNVNSSVIWVFVNDTIPPSFNETLSNISTYAGYSVYYWINASDLSGVDAYYINDTVRFKINRSTGIMENITSLTAGTFAVNITVNDTLGNINYSAITVFVSDIPTTPATETGGRSTHSGIFYTPPAEETEPVLEVPSASVSSITAENINLNPFACTEVAGVSQTTSSIKPGTSISNLILKPGYEVLVSPFKVECTDSSFKISLSLPDSYTNITALRCRGNDCSAVSLKEIFNLECGEDIFENIERTSSVLSPEFFPLPLERVESKPGTAEVSSSRTRLVFSGIIDGKLAIDKVFGDVPEAQNPKIKIVSTPTQILFDSLNQKPMNITLPYLFEEKVDEYSIALYALKNNEWNYIGGTVNAGSKTVTAEIRNVSEFAENKILTVAAMGLVCLNCYDGKLTKVYDGTSRDAVLLIHGFENSPERFEEMINEMKLTNQPWQVWTYGYPSSKTIEENAKELADLLQAKSGEFDYIHAVGHSMGGMIAQEVLAYAEAQNKGKTQRPYTFVDKFAKVIAVASPNEGTITSNAKEYFNKFLNEKIGFLFNLNSKVLAELLKGKQISRAENVEYLAVAGTMPYDFTKFFAEDTVSDGLVSLESAQNIGGVSVDDYCEDFWSLNTTHFDLLNNFDSRKIIERIISKEVSESAGGKGLIGYNQYFELAVDLCSPNDQYIIIGEKLNKDRQPNPGLCNCGNGVCGVDEDEFNCPVDCARIEMPKETWWQILLRFAPIRNMLIVLLLILTAIAVLSRKHRKYTAMFSLDEMKMKEAWLNERIVHIRYHLKMNELDEAAAEYSKFVEEYNSSPALLKEKFKEDARKTRNWVESKIR
ncbi:right-handed parallel beta-helix repeat-containing protein [Candidatus Woesearchaeota archaeon]|nr:right-handed parallel beta-helix repeat-containing protein [Candidatus Woesearchaeota archaeon]